MPAGRIVENQRGAGNPKIPKFEERRAETRFDRECVSSNPLTPANQSDNLRLCSHKSHKLPPIAGFCKLAARLQTPKSPNSEAKLPRVSVECLKYSRFWETDAGDRVRFTLRGRPSSRFARDRCSKRLGPYIPNLHPARAIVAVPSPIKGSR